MQHQERGRPKNATPIPSAPTVFPASCSAPFDYCASFSMAGTTKRGRGNDREKSSFIEKPGMPSSKICSTGQVRVTRSADITDNIGYTSTSTSKLKWNGKAAISTKKLQEIKEKKRKKNVGSSSNNSSKKNTSSKSKMP
ncbi:hypothetical protein T459_02740 [Capsicum annuum]|uniref:Uncharacterized protein n=1 Tax=Capsicum annuum TaxID=4072 RepID=A0A2G3AKY6_CAPAN|nr:hypothetical protein T459_02740 [Capsicum annuum]